MGASSPTRRPGTRSRTPTSNATWSAAVLEVDRLSVSIASMQILRELSLEVPTGSMTGLIGRNGAGKTTVMKTVMGLLKAGGGSVRFESRDLLGVATHQRARLGIGYMPEDRRLIP